MSSPLSRQDIAASCLSRDQGRLLRLQRECGGARQPEARAQAQARLDHLVAVSRAAVASRAARLPALSYPDLPVSARAEDIIRAIREHQVVVVAGETGSGKTTQLPKLALAAGRGVRGYIGHTQPRRIAARSVAARIAEELQSPPRRAGWLQGALHRRVLAGRLRQAHDGRGVTGRAVQ